MPFGLNDARATLTIDASGFVSGAQQAAASLDALDASGSRTAQSNALIETRLRSVAAALSSAAGESSGYSTALNSAAAAAGSAAARVDQLAIKAEAARAALSNAQQSAAASAAALHELQEASDINDENIAAVRAELDALQQSGNASQTEIAALTQTLQELEADSADLANQIQSETQNVEASGEAAAQAAVKYNTLAAQLKAAEASADKADGKFAQLAETVDNSSGIGALAQGLNKWGSSTLTSASRSLSTMAASLIGLQNGTAGTTLASNGLAEAMRTITRIAGPYGVALGGAATLAISGAKKLSDAWNESHDFGAAMQNAIDNASDNSYTAALKNVNIELGDEDHIKTQISEKLQHCFDTLTDGKADSPEIVSELHAEIDEEYSGIRAQVEDYFEKAIEGAETEAAKDALIEKQNEILASIDATHEAANALVDSYAGKSTEECKKAKEEIEAIQEQVDDLISGINTARALLESQYGDAYAKVSGGYYATQQDIEWSLTYVGANRTNAEAAANEAYETASKALNDAFAGHDGSESLQVEYEVNGVKYTMNGTFDELTHQIEGEHQAAMNTAQAELIAQWNAMIAGLGQSGSLGAEASAALEQMAAAVDVKAAIDAIAQRIADGTVMPADLEGLGDSFWQSLGTALDTNGAEAQQMFQDALAISPMAAAGLLAAWENPINAALTQGAGEMEGGFGQLMAAAVETGLFEGIDGVDMNDAMARYQALVGQLAMDGENLETQPVPVEIRPEVTQIDDPSQQPIAIDEPLQAEAPVEVVNGVWTFDESEAPTDVFSEEIEVEAPVSIEPEPAGDGSIAQQIVDKINAGILEGVPGVDTSSIEGVINALFKPDVIELFGDTPITFGTLSEVEELLAAQLPEKVSVPVDAVELEPGMLRMKPSVIQINEEDVRDDIFGTDIEVPVEYALPDPDELALLYGNASVPIEAEFTLPSPEELAALDGVSNEFAAAGSNAGSAFVDALNGYLAPAAAAGAAIAAAALNAMKARLSIHSPSKATFKMGLQTGEGFSLGIAERAEMARESMKHMANSALRGARGAQNVNNNRTMTINLNNASIRSEDDVRKLSRALGRYMSDFNYGQN